MIVKRTWFIVAVAFGVVSGCRHRAVSPQSDLLVTGQAELRFEQDPDMHFMEGPNGDAVQAPAPIRAWLVVKHKGKDLVLADTSEIPQGVLVPGQKYTFSLSTANSGGGIIHVIDRLEQNGKVIYSRSENGS